MILNLAGLTLLIVTNSFGYVSHLIAWNYEKQLSYIALKALVINIVLSCIFALLLESSVVYILLPMMISYLIFGILTTKLSLSCLGFRGTIWTYINHMLPAKIYVPYFVAIFMSLTIGSKYYLLVFVIFFIMNYKDVLHLFQTVRSLVLDPSRVDLS